MGSVSGYEAHDLKREWGGRVEGGDKPGFRIRGYDSEIYSRCAVTGEFLSDFSLLIDFEELEGGKENLLNRRQVLQWN
jgi:hypothetical protein